MKVEPNHLKVAFYIKNKAYENALRLLMNCYSEHGSDVVILSSLHKNENEYSSYNLLFVGSGGNDLKLIIKQCNLICDRPKIISIFPGIVVKEQYDAYLTRIHADVVLLNSSEDFQQYQRYCELLKVPNNGVIYGAGWYEKPIQKIKKLENGILFVEQIDIPRTRTARTKLLDRLTELSKVHGEKILILIRQDKKDNPRSFKSLIKPRHKQNLVLIEGDVNQIVHSVKRVISYSSSVLVSAILANKEVVILDGKRSYFTHFFFKSGCVSSLRGALDENLPIVNPYWAKNNISNPYNNLGYLVSNLSKVDQRKINPKVSFRLCLNIVLNDLRSIFKLVYVFKSIKKYIKL